MDLNKDHTESIYIKIEEFFRNIIKQLSFSSEQIFKQNDQIESMFANFVENFDIILAFMTNIFQTISLYLNNKKKQQEENMNSYQDQLQKLEAKLRKHIKIQIQLKLYYEHLEQRLEEQTKKYQQLEQKYQKREHTLNEQTKNMKQKINIKMEDSIINPVIENEQVTKKPKKMSQKDSVNKIKSKLSFHEINEFTKRGNYNSYKQYEIRQNLENTNIAKQMMKNSLKFLKNFKQLKKSKSKDKATQFKHFNTQDEILKKINRAKNNLKYVEKKNLSNRNSIGSGKRSGSINSLSQKIQAPQYSYRESTKRTSKQK